MSKEDLCWECRQDLMYYDVKKSYHCHHEPKEKKRCWCERGASRAKLWDGRDYVMTDYCPQCGKKLS